METQSEPARKVPLDKYGYNTIARNMSIVLISCLPLFLMAGTWSWDWAWVYTIAMFIGWAGLNIIVAIENPGLFNQRGRPSKEVMAGAKRWDMVILTIYSVLMFVVPIVAGLDYRNRWSEEVSPAIHLFGIALLMLGFIPLTWGMVANKFFEPTVKIQTERGHTVVDNGPYRIIRHPGYLGVILHFLAVPFALGTLTAFIPALMGAGIYVLRTALEDKTLREELAGYAEFAERTPYRLLPGVW